MSKPLYSKLYDDLIAKIASGELPPGSMLPSEIELGQASQVSPGTARKAVSELERKGIVERRQGKGTFVRVRTPENALFQFFRLRDQRGGQAIPSLADEQVRRRKATAREAKLLDGGPKTVFEIDRVRTISKRRLVREISVVSSALFPGLIERVPLPNALYVLYQQAYGCAIVHAEEKLKAVISSSRDAELLDIAPGSALLSVERIAKDVPGRVVELRLSKYATGDLTYDVALT